MSAVVLHLALLAVVGLWLILRPFRTLRRVFACWWIGLALHKAVPLVLAGWLGGIFAQEAHYTAAPSVISFIGAILLFRAALELILWDRRRGTWLWIALGLFVLGQLLGATGYVAAAIGLLLCLPLLPSYRWRSGMRAAGLMQATLALVLTAVLSAIQQGHGDAGALSEAAGDSASLTTTVVAVYSLMGIPVLARKLHLSIRRIRLRLVISHLLVSIVPVGLAVLFLLLSGTLFVSTYRGQIIVRRLHAESEEAVRRMDVAVAETGRAPLHPFGSTVSGQTVIVKDDDGVRVLTGAEPRVPAEHFFEHRISSMDAPLLWDGNALYIRSRWEGIDAGGDSLRIEAFCLLDSLRMAEITDLLGTPAWIDPQLVVQQTRAGVTITRESGALDERPEHIDTSTLGSGRLPGGSVIPLLAWEQETESWRRVSAPVLSTARFGEQFGSLLTAAHENPLAAGVLVVLGLIAVLLIGTVLITAAMVSGMVRSVTSSVRALTRATQAIGRGDLSYRISLEAKDELWDVAESFNRMSEDLVRMQAAELERRRMEEDLRLAREIQDRLLPSGAPDLPGMDLAGTSIPAREVGGDYYDFILLPEGKVWLVVADVSGKGTPAAMLMSAFRAALRSQDLTVSGPAEILGRVNSFIHTSVDPGRFITAFVAVLDPESGRIRYANAGHDAPLVLGPDGTIRELSGGGLILGMLPKIVYEDASSVLEQGDTLLVYTDGITEAKDQAGEFFGMDRLRSVLGDAVDGSAAGVLDRTMHAVRGFRGDEPQSDDITMLVARRM